MLKNNILIINPFVKKKELKNKNLSFLNVKTQYEYLKFNEEIDYLNQNILDKNFSLKENEINKRLKEINYYFEKILTDLSIKLNKFHNLNYSKNFWRVLLGPWLNFFLNTFSYSFYNLKKLIKKNYKFQIMEYKNFSFTSNETFDFYNNSGNPIWFGMFNSFLLENLLKNQTRIIKKKIKIKKSKNYSYYDFQSDRDFKSHVKKKNILFRFLNFIYSLFFFNNINLIDISISGIINFKLHFLFKQKFNLNLLSKIKFSKINVLNRQFFNLKNELNKNQFEKMLSLIIPKVIPNIYLESFKTLNKKLDSLELPKKPKFIITSNSYQDNDFFKLYVAKCKEKLNTKYFIIQHGNNIFTDKLTNYSPELKSCDYFISWGTERLKPKNKFLSAFNIKTVNKKVNINYNGKFVFFLRSMNPDQTSVVDRFHENIIGYKNLILLTKKLNEKINIKEKFMFRFAFNHKKNEVIKNLFVQNLDFKNVNKDFFLISKKKLYKKSTLNIHMYDATGFLEDISLNFPSICFLPLGLKMLNQSAKVNYKKLINQKVMFDNISKLATHLQHLNEKKNLIKWWNNKTLQSELQNFKKKYSFYTSKDGSKEIKKLINNIVIKKNNT